MAYSREDIDKVKDRTDLGELAAEVTKVKRSGRSVMAVCPFHNEKTPSLSIDPARGLYHCFGCGKSGDVFSWVEETHGVDFVGALELLARRAGVALTESPGEGRRRSQREALVAAVADAVEFYRERLRSAPDAAAARSYVRGRGYDADIVERFDLGYSPQQWDDLTVHLLEKGHRDKTLQVAGLASRSRRGTLIDRFRGRVMFPIFDLRGDPVGFGARLLEGEGPKYLNSAESPIYHKSRLLYGLNWAKGAIVREHEAVVVEGYTDVIAFHLAERPVAVATCGTALVDEHLDLLRRFTERVVLSFDSDAAGTGAALRGFDKAVPGELDLRVGVLPEGRDPADLVRDGEIDALRKAIADSIPLLQFRIEQDLANYDMNEAEARGRAATAAARLAAMHPDPVVRHEYAVMVSRRTGVDLGVVEDALRRSGSPRRATPAAPQVERRLTGQEKAERELLRLMLANDATLAAVQIDPELFTNEEHRAGYAMIAPAIAHLDPGTPPDLGALFADEATALTRMLSALALSDRPLSEAAGLVARLEREQLDDQIDKVRERLAGLDPDSDPQGYSATSQELIALEQKRREVRGRR
ncbi:MAG TPA: DNA primase [Acidimicrobiia bacterium]|nr:DNA primase [Acidimicrobiia bacterium]